MEALASVTEINPQNNIEKKKKASTFLIALVCCSFAFCSGLIYYWYIYSLSRITTDDAFIDAELSPVNSRILGFISEVAVTEGQEIHKGDLLVALDDSDVKIELKLKQSRFLKTQRDAERAKSLKQSNAISKVDYENAEALMAATTADLDGAKLKSKFTRILAPFDGIVAKRSVQAGQFVQPGQSLLVLIPKKDPWIKANYKETQIYKMKLGQNVRIKIDAFPGRVWNGKVESILPSTGSKLSLLPPENSTGNFTKVVQRVPVRISIQNPSGTKLRVGMSVITTVIVDN